MTPNQERVAEVLAANLGAPMPSAKIAYRAQLPHAEALQALNDLRTQGIIQRSRPSGRKQSRWRLRGGPDVEPPPP